jgi:hypothetical protein
MASSKPKNVAMFSEICLYNKAALDWNLYFINHWKYKMGMSHLKFFLLPYKKDLFSYRTIISNVSTATTYKTCDTMISQSTVNLKLSLLNNGHKT